MTEAERGIETGTWTRSNNQYEDRGPHKADRLLAEGLGGQSRGFPQGQEFGWNLESKSLESFEL